ncbi:MAG: hypothetical protein ACRDIY_23540 [Chloroflexota bacterium]
MKSERALSTWIVLGFFVVWTIVATYPLALAPANHIENWGDPLLNVWIPAWDLHQLARDPLHLFDAPIFYPAHDTLALSELLLAQAVEMLPIVALTGNFILAYNLVVLVSFVLCGFGAYLLAREAMPPTASLVAGAAYAYSFYRVGEFSHIQILSAQWIPFAMLALLHLWRRPNWRITGLFAACVILQLLSSFYLGLFLLVTLVFELAFLVVADRRPPSVAVLARLVGAAALTAVVVLPFSLPYFQVEREFGLARSLGDAIGGSATFRSYLAVPPTSWLYGQAHLPLLQHFPTDETLFPGVILLALAIVGLVAGWQRRWSAFFLALAIFGLVFSFGPRFHLTPGDESGFPLPYGILFADVPGFHSIRVVGRMGVIATLGVAGLAGLGAAVLIARAPTRWQTAVGLLLAILVGLETLSIPVRMTPVETPSEVPPVYRWLAARPDDAPALELPTIQHRWLDNAAELERQGHEEYLSIYHWHPTPSGYSGFEPPLFWSVMREAGDFPTDESIDFFQSIGLKYLIFHQDQYPAGQWQQVAARLADHADVLRPLARFGGDSVYELTQPGLASALPVPRIVLPSMVAAGSTYRGFLDWSNPDAVARVSQPKRLAVQVAWQGATASSDAAIIAEPKYLAQGDTTVPFDVSAPGSPGRYRLTVNADRVSASATIDVAEPPTGPVPNDPRPSMQLVSAQLATSSAEPGDVVFATATWRLRHRTLDNYLLRIEVVDAKGSVVASGTIDPFDGALETARWLPGESVALGQSAILPKSLPPGDYAVRLLVRFADGATWKMAGPDNNDHDSVSIGTLRVQ